MNIEITMKIIFTVILLSDCCLNIMIAKTEQKEKIYDGQSIIIKRILRNSLSNYNTDGIVNHNKNDDEKVQRLTNSKSHYITNSINNNRNSRNYDYDDNSDDLSDEIMKTSEQIAFRPLFRRFVPAVIFRHKQMMEERKKRKETRRRISDEQSDRRNPNYNNNDLIYICYGQICRPITTTDIRQLQLSQRRY
ncbi:uncharacterized protein LOC142320925 isoform X1 [Lycorma delicatula]|uniref:uncharacterized protein LOC142320925 isoform X1 n=1 Tax=Lycorma delicatula TaxID=130591 RepID=UPI003F519873